MLGTGVSHATITEVEIDEDGRIKAIDPTVTIPPGRAFLAWKMNDLLSPFEQAFADWLRPEEDEAWAYLQGNMPEPTKTARAESPSA